MRLVPIFVVALLLLLQAPAAHADEEQDARASAVVATTPQGTTLAAADATQERGEDRIVLTQRGTGDSVEEPRFDDTDTDLVPIWHDESVTLFNRVYQDEITERVVIGGVVTAEVMAIEQRFANGTVLRAATVPGDAYTGRYAGRVRFFLIETLLPSEALDDIGALRMLDASGAVLAVDDNESTSRRVQLLRERVGGATIGIYGTLTSTQVALPLAPEHRRDSLCMGVEHGAGFPYDASDESACQSIEELTGAPALRLGGLRGCDRVPTTLTGFIPVESRRLVVVLGSGRELRVPARTTPYGRPERVVAAVLPPGEAIRRVRAVDGAGRTLARADVEVAPPDRRCGEPTPNRGSWSFTSERPRVQPGVPPGTQVVVADPTGPQLLVRDFGERLCWGIDALALDGRDCEDPQENSRYGFLEARPHAGGYLLWGTFAARVATLELKLGGGGRMAIPLTDGPAYTGRYRGAVRFALFALAADVDVEDIALLDAAGLRVGVAGVLCLECDDGEDEPRPTTVLAAGTGSARVRVGASATVGRPKRSPCIAFATAGERMDTCTEFQLGDGTALARVSCARRQTIVYGMTHRTVRRVEIRLASGRVVNARLAAFPRQLGVKGFAFLAVLPAHAAVTGVKFAGVKVEDRSNTIPMPLRPAVRQCGYTYEKSL